MNRLLDLAQLLRWPNLLMILVCLLGAQFGILKQLFDSVGLEVGMAAVPFLLLSLSVVLIAAAANIHNDYEDRTADRINKAGKNLLDGRLDAERFMDVYYYMNACALLIVAAMAWFLDDFNIVYPFVLAVPLLFVYNSSLQYMPLIGNLVISILIATLLFLPVLFEPAYRSSFNLDLHRNTAATVLILLSGYAGFAFLSNLYREMIKDIQDIKGDSRVGSNSLPIAIGSKPARFLSIGLGISLILSFVWCGKQLWENASSWAITYAIVLVFGPMVLSVIRLFSNSESALKQSSLLIKLCMFFGLGSLFLLVKFG